MRLHFCDADDQLQLYCERCDMVAYCVDCRTHDGRMLSAGWFVPEGHLCAACARKRSAEPDWYVGPVHSVLPSKPPESEVPPYESSWLGRWWGKLMCAMGDHTDGKPNQMHWSEMTCIRCGKTFTI